MKDFCVGVSQLIPATHFWLNLMPDAEAASRPCLEELTPFDSRELHFWQS